MLREKKTDARMRIILGPYPTEDDFVELKRLDVTTILCLLSKDLPHEEDLIKKEKSLTEKHNINLIFFPMKTPKDKDYEKIGKQAAKYAASAKDKVYIHCYTGSHRMRFVKELLESGGFLSGKYMLRPSNRSFYDQQLDRAEANFNDRAFEEVVQILQKLGKLDLDGTLLLAWAQYRLGEFDKAKALFETVQSDSLNAISGLGYCAMQEEKHQVSKRYFEQALKVAPGDPSSLMGMGIVHFRMSRFEESSLYLNKLLALQPENNEAKDLLKKIETFKQKNNKE